MTNKPGEGRQIGASIVSIFAVISRRQGTWHTLSKPTDRWDLRAIGGLIKDAHSLNPGKKCSSS